MTKTTGILFAAAALIAVKAFSKVNAATKLSFVLRDIKVKVVSIWKIQITLYIGVQNVANENLNVGALVGDLSLNGKFIANVSYFNSTQVKGRSETVIPVLVEPTLFSVLSDLYMILTQTTNKKLEFSFTGHINADAITVPVDFKYSVLNWNKTYA